MLNDVKIPPLEPSDEQPRGQNPRRPKNVSQEAIPPAPGPLKADVTLFDSDTTQPGGIGNFWSLSIFVLVLLFVLALGAYLFVR